MAQRRTLMMPWKIMRWVDSPLNNADLNRSLPQGGTLAADDQGRRVYFHDRVVFTILCRQSSDGNFTTRHLLDSYHGVHRQNDQEIHSIFFIFIFLVFSTSERQEPVRRALLFRLFKIRKCFQP